MQKYQSETNNIDVNLFLSDMHLDTELKRYIDLIDTKTIAHIDIYSSSPMVNEMPFSYISKKIGEKLYHGVSANSGMYEVYVYFMNSIPFFNYYRNQNGIRFNITNHNKCSLKYLLNHFKNYNFEYKLDELNTSVIDFELSNEEDFENFFESFDDYFKI